MSKIPNELREIIARNIRDCRLKKFPGRGGGKKCAEAFGVSPQQWSPWERGMRTPDELRLSQIANFFDVTVEYLRRDNSSPKEMGNDNNNIAPPFYGSAYNNFGAPPPSAPLREPEAPPYGLPSLRRDDNITSGSNITDLAISAARLLNLIATTNKGVAEGRFDINKAIIVLRRLGDLLEHRLREAETATVAPGQPY